MEGILPRQMTSHVCWAVDVPKKVIQKKSIFERLKAQNHKKM